MKAYVFDEYRDKSGTGSYKYDTDLERLLEEAQAHWNHLSEGDKDSYKKDTSGQFRVYEIELEDEEWEELNDSEGELIASEFWTRDIWDALDPIPVEARIFGDYVPTYFDSLEEAVKFFDNYYEERDEDDILQDFDGIETIEQLQEVCDRIANWQDSVAPKLSVWR